MMPSAQDWLINPLGVVQDFVADEKISKLDWEKRALEYFKEKLKETEAASWVPSLNDVPLHYLKPNSLVKFRCMVQDMFDPEYYMGVYETVEPSTQARVLHIGKYRDVAECEPQHEVDLQSQNNITMERQTFYCVPVPGEAQWVKESYASSSQARVSPSTSYTPCRHKRSYEEDEDMDAQPYKQKEQLTATDAQADSKRLETEALLAQQSSAPTCSPPLDLNFPLPGEKGPACLVKVYENWENFKVNDIVEVYGVLSVDPALSVLSDHRDDALSMDPMEADEEQRVHSPPASLVPRLHAILAHKLKHVNPLVPASLCTEDGKGFVSNFLTDLVTVRAELLGLLTGVLLGDGVAAEYLLLHLISDVYARHDVLPLGKFTVNLSGCPCTSSYTERLYRIIQLLVPCSYHLCMTLHNMNSLKFIPHKDYAANRLVSGVLQLARNTSLFVDETQLEQGQLDSTGVQNLAALGNLIMWQKVDYDFNYHRMEFPCNINVLITSEGRSLLPFDCQVHLQPQVAPPHLEQYMQSLQDALLPSLLTKFRVYLSLVRHLEYSISAEVTKAVEDDFVEMRKNEPRSVSAEDLHRMLVVARLLSLSVGQTSLSREWWQRTKELEILRRRRLEQQKCVNGNEL
ncbi:mini-chromosome maintenance complex-binding protein isoform X1 [Polypterus senegalus]|uniref:mini-chromosome maintenance complex-binding protein isoform X1 n=1 Tax=Polypterus senegalus TaxID=55291 RepID=UPI0019632295|nr:mini-chromosome maintenance complex-binding protein isoform X1 [Polypterus senegalus]